MSVKGGAKRGIINAWDEIAERLGGTTAQRMARADAQGYDPRTWYHGSGNIEDISNSGFRSSLTGKGNDQYGSGFYFTNEPSTASGYATGRIQSDIPKLGGEGAEGVIQSRLRLENPVIINASEVRNLNDGVFDLSTEQVRKMLNRSDAVKRPLDSDDMNPLGDHYESFWSDGPEDWMLDDIAEKYSGKNIDYIEQELFDGDSQAFRDALADVTGHDGVIVNFDSGESHAIAWRPDQVRSVNADFNPANKDSSNLLAGLGGAAVLGGAMAPQKAEAGPLKVFSHMDQAGKAIYKTVIDSWHGSPHKFPSERLIRKADGSEEYVVGAYDTLPDIPDGAELIEDYPLGRMRMDKIGTGEGAQAYSHGLYSADSEGVGRGYRESLSLGDSDVQVANKLGIPPSYETKYFAGQLKANGGDVQKTVDDLVSYAESFRDSGDATAYNNLMGLHALMQLHARASEKFPNGGTYLPNDSTGALYRIEIDVDPDTLLDWDKPLSEQSEAVQEAVRSSYAKSSLDSLTDDEFYSVMQNIDSNGVYSRDAQLAEFGSVSTKDEILSDMAEYNPDELAELRDYLEGDIDMSLSGGSLYKQGTAQRGGGNVYTNKAQAELSAALNEAGIPGIRYPDGYSRGRWELSTPDTTSAGDWMVKDADQPLSQGRHFDNEQDALAELAERKKVSSNYVMFDDKNIRITERGNIDPTLLAGMGAGAITAEQLLAEKSRAAAEQFGIARSGRKEFWQERRQELVEALSYGFNSPEMSGIPGVSVANLFEAMDIPTQGLYGLVSALSNADQGLEQAVQKGATVAQQPIDQTAQQFGDYVYDQTGSPVLATTGLTAATLFGPI